VTGPKRPVSDRVEAVLRAARGTAGVIRAGGPVRLPLALAERVATLLEACDDVAALAHEELVALESARDVEDPA
jgi:hypothetical protein